MNPEPQILNLASETQPAPQPENAAADALLNFEHRGNGKVARLPKPTRDQINQMLLDGLPYTDIVQRLGEHGHDLKPAHIGEWKKRGYRDWLLQQEWLDRMTSKSSFSADILNAPETNNLHEAGLRFAAAQMFDQLMRFNAMLDAPDSPDTSDKFARLVNALSRLNRAALSFKKYNDLCAKEKAAELKRLDPTRKLNQNECAALAKVWDDFFLGPDYDPMAHPLHEVQPAPQPTAVSPTPSSASRPPAPKSNEGGPGIAPIPPAPCGSPLTIGLGKASGVRASSSASASISPPSTEPETPAADATPSLQLSTYNLQPGLPLTDSLTHSFANCPSSTIPPPVPEYCPRCHTLLPPRMPTGERAGEYCLRCGGHPRLPGFPIEACDNCQNLVPDLLPNGRRAHPDCPHCKKPLPPPPPLPHNIQHQGRSTD